MTDNFESLYQKFKPQTGKDKAQYIIETAEYVQEKKLNGDIAEFGVFRGGISLILSYVFPQKKLHLFDTFEGIPNLAVTEDEKKHEGGFSLLSRYGFSKERTFEEVKSRFKDKYAIFYKGLFSDVCYKADRERFCFVYIDTDLYVSTKQGITFFYPKMVKGGILIFDDWGFSGVIRAIKEFMIDKPEKIKTSKGIAIIEKQ